MHRKSGTGIVVGFVAAAVLTVTGGLLQWGSSYTSDMVDSELSAQRITFPDAAALEEEGRTDLVKYAEEQVNTGPEARAYASFIQGHIDRMANGQTYSEIPDRAAKAAVEEAKANGAGEATVAELQAKADELTALRNTVFKGETLRGLLLNAYGWSTIGLIAGYSAAAAFLGAMLATVLAVFGLIVRRSK